MNNELYHYGVLGMRWGHRKNNYLSKGASGYTKRKLGLAKNIT